MTARRDPTSRTSQVLESLGLSARLTGLEFTRLAVAVTGKKRTGRNLRNDLQKAGLIETYVALTPAGRAAVAEIEKRRNRPENP